MTEFVRIPLDVWQRFRGASNEVMGSAVVDEDAVAITLPAPMPSPAPAPAASEGAERFFVDSGKFYDFLRTNNMLGPKISADEFSGCETIISACGRANWPVSWVAYALATAYHETAHTMLPVHERGGPAYLHRMYDINGNRPAKARELGNLAPGDGVKYAGRGYPQTTGKSNYAKATAALRSLGFEDIDLIARPDDMMRPDVAAATMISGMEKGWFTGRKITDDLPDQNTPATLAQFIPSRDVINGRDKDDEIAVYAIDFQTGLVAGGYRPLA